MKLMQTNKGELSFGMTIFNIGERAKTNGMIFVQSILVTYYGLNLELGR